MTRPFYRHLNLHSSLLMKWPKHRPTCNQVPQFLAHELNNGHFPCKPETHAFRKSSFLLSPLDQSYNAISPRLLWPCTMFPICFIDDTQVCRVWLHDFLDWYYTFWCLLPCLNYIWILLKVFVIVTLSYATMDHQTTLNKKHRIKPMK